MNKKKIVIIILAILVVITGIMPIITNNIHNSEIEYDENGLRIIKQNSVMYVSINPLLKLTFEESFKQCSEEATSAICSDIETRIVDVKLLNKDAKRIYNNVNLLGKDIYTGIKRIVEEANENDINTTNIDLITDSGNFLLDHLQLGPNVNVNFKFSVNINEDDILFDDANKFVVKFDTDGGNKILSQTITRGGSVKSPDNPTKDGYVFVEWLYDDQTYDFSTPVENNMTLKAKWSKVAYTLKETKYTVSFDTDGGSSVGPQVVNAGEKVTKPVDPVKGEQVFVEWQSEGEEYDFDSPVNDDTTLKALWEDEKKGSTYVVSFNSNGGSKVSPQSIKENNKAKEPAKPIRQEYKFVEWQLNGKTYDFGTPVTSHITLDAVWIKD